MTPALSISLPSSGKVSATSPSAKAHAALASARQFASKMESLAVIIAHLDFADAQAADDGRDGLNVERLIVLHILD